jgi:hypothetical protein
MVNLQNFLISKISKENYKLIATIVKFFYDDDLFTDEFLIDWPNNNFKKEFKKHSLY